MTHLSGSYPATARPSSFRVGVSVVLALAGLGCSETTAPGVPSDIVFTTLAAGYEHTCGLTVAGVAHCWGGNDDGDIGDGTTNSRLTPVVVQGGPVFAALTAGGTAQWIGGSHTCGLTAVATAYCWGSNAKGQLGDGSTINQLTPVAVQQNALAFTTLTAGYTHTCGLTNAGAAYCWGDNRYGGLGDGTTVSRSTPVAVAGGIAFAALTASQFFTCGLTSAGAAYCWGYNAYGALGGGTAVSRSTPGLVQGGLAFATIAARGLEGGGACGLTRAGATYCWGGQNRADVGSLVPVKVDGGLAFTALVGGGTHTCALTSAGAAYCWGMGQSGQLGNGSTSDVVRRSPVAVHQGGLVFTALVAGSAHTCGVTGAGAAYCWGSNNGGALGDGTTQMRSTPTAVARP